MTPITTILHIPEEDAALQILRPLLHLAENAGVSMDDAYAILVGQGWHVLKVDGYDPSKGGPALYIVFGINASGILRKKGRGPTLRSAFLDLVAQVIS
mgnify:CR=1 FL=1